MAHKSCIPGYDEDIAEERKLREEIYLDLPHDICGVKINHITPRLLARLNQLRSPFVCGGPLVDAHIVQFLWVTSINFKPFPTNRDRFISETVNSLYGRYDEAEEEIDAFVEATFMDAPSGGKEETPYACSIAWMEYSMAKEPFRWDSERTLNTPLRRIFQLSRCRSLENGADLVNRKSDARKGEWLANLQSHLDTLSPKERADLIARINRRDN